MRISNGVWLSVVSKQLTAHRRGLKVVKNPSATALAAFIDTHKSVNMYSEFDITLSQYRTESFFPAWQSRGAQWIRRGGPRAPPEHLAAHFWRLMTVNKLSANL